MEAYDYEVVLKPWREITLKSECISKDGIKLGKKTLSFEEYNRLRTQRFFAIDTGFMGVLVYFDEYGVQLNSIKNKDVEFYFGYDIWTYKKYIPDPIFEISTELRLAVSKTMGIPAHMLGDSGKGFSTIHGK